MSPVVMALAVLVQIPAATAVPPSGQDEPATLSEVVVESRIPEELAREFIDQVAAPPRGATVARWNERVCVGVVNLRPETAQFLIDRVSSVALDLGLEPGQPGCDPVVVIVASRDGGAIARGLVERRRRVLAPGNRIESRSSRDLEAFVEVDRPVRWWHISTSVNPATGGTVIRNRHNETHDGSVEAILESNATFQSSGSVITSGTRQHLRRAVIIIDFDRLGDVNFDQLADYVTFVALAQVDPEGDTSSFRTILNVFDTPAATPGLTDWDRAYLQGLYNSDDTAISSGGREAALRREMLRAREGSAAAAEGE